MSKKILVAMSGGVDSTIAAYKLKIQGFDVIGVHFRFWKWRGNDFEYQKELQRLHRLTDQIGIRLIEVDAQETFKTRVIREMFDQIGEGLTPNPCIHCNPKMKFDYLINTAQNEQIDMIATGHYVRAELKNNEFVGLYKAIDLSKDQSYFLCQLNQDILRNCIFPLGVTTKQDNMILARQLGLNFDDKPESQDLCFLSNASYAQFVSEELPEIVVPGEIRDITGKVIGKHHGLPTYTIGQRKGIEIAADKPYYVISKDPRKNVLVVGSKENLKFRSMIISGVNWVSGYSPDHLACKVKIRYRSPDYDCQLVNQDQNNYRVEFSHDIRDITPGQYAVFYQGDELLGGGMIQTVEN